MKKLSYKIRKLPGKDRFWFISPDSFIREFLKLWNSILILPRIEKSANEIYLRMKKLSLRIRKSGGNDRFWFINPDSFRREFLKLYSLIMILQRRFYEIKRNDRCWFIGISEVNIQNFIKIKKMLSLNMLT